MIKLFNLKMNQGPWGPWSGAENPQNKNGAKNPDNNKGDSAKDSGKENKPQKPAGDNFTKKIDDLFEKFFGGGSSNQGGSGKSDPKKTKRMVSFFVLGFLSLWLLTGFYKIDPDENGIVLYFGKFYSISTPGLNYYIPYPFGKLIKQSVTRINTEEFGYNSSSSKYSKKDLEAESLMLTGDENIVDIDFQVQWQVSNIEEFTFNITEPRIAIRKAAESIMREVIARTPITEALSGGKSKIEITAKDLLQQTLDYYKAGVRITSLKLQRVDPPAQVIDAFRDVQTAKADKEKEINQGQAYANDIIPRARGEAAQMLEQAEAYKQEVVANAQGDAQRFVSVYQQYSQARQVTKKRMYLETMEKIYGDIDKVLIDKSTAKSGVTPYFPLNDLTAKKATTDK